MAKKTAAQLRTALSKQWNERETLRKRLTAVSVPEARKATYRRRIIELDASIPKLEKLYQERHNEERAEATKKHTENRYATDKAARKNRREAK